MDIGTTAIENAQTAQASITDAAEAGTARATAAFTAGLADASAHLEKSSAQMRAQIGQAMKSAQDVAGFNKETIEAIVKSGQIWATGMQDLSRQFAATAQGQLEHALTTFKALSTLRSLKDIADLQSGFARAAMETAMTQTGRLTDAGFKLAEDVMAPLSARVGAVVETFSKAA